MKQAMLYKTGGPDSFKICSAPELVLTDEEILVNVEYAGVAFADVMMRHGKYPKMPALPFVPGYDICGIVKEVGNSVAGIRKGDKVIALTQFGGYSQQTKVHYKRAVAVPNNVSGADGACLVLNYISAYDMLHKYKHFIPANKILVHSAAGGVGTALLQIARSMGLKVYGTCSTSKMDIVKRNGGIPLDYTKCDFAEVLKQLEPDGFDAAFDPVGGAHWLKSRSILKSNGILVGFGFFSMFDKDNIIGGIMDSGKIILKLILVSFIPGSRKFKLYSIQPGNHTAVQKSLTAVKELYLAGKIKPEIFKIYPLEEVGKAHFDLANSVSHGKIILDCTK